jgi:putative ABC transport system permease protein
MRSAATPDTTMSVVRAALNRIDRGLPILWPSTVDAIVNDSIGQERLTVTLLGVFAAVALLLAILGVYGAVAYSVEQRTSEIGVRMALGAQRHQVLRLILRQALALTVIGLALGAVGALAVTSLIRRQLFEVSPTNPLTYASIAVLLLGTALLASYVPARRATRIDPVGALRQE